MNRRIQKLAIEAGLSHMPSNCSDMADLYKGADFELEKFAELLVSKCISAVYCSDIKEKKQEAVIRDMLHNVFGDAYYQQEGSKT